MVSGNLKRRLNNKNNELGVLGNPAKSLFKYNDFEVDFFKQKFHTPFNDST